MADRSDLRSTGNSPLVDIACARADEHTPAK